MRLAFLCTILLHAVLPLHGQDSIVKQVTFCRSLAENQTPGEKVDAFMPEDTVHVSVELKGRPKSGVLASRFLMEDTLLAEAKVDLASVNKGILFSVGQNTFAGFNLTHANPLPVGEMYRVELSLDGKPFGSFPFRISPPKGAIESKLKSAVLEKEVAEKRHPLEADAALAPEDSVVLKGVADLGLSTWLRAQWLVNGKLDSKGTHSITMEENKADCAFLFSFRPDQGWPLGRHEVILAMNGKEVARRAFSVKSVLPPRTALPPAGPIQIAGFTLLRGDGKGDKMTPVSAFAATDTVLYAEWNLKTPISGSGMQYKWIQVEAGDIKDALIGKADLPEGSYQKLRTSLKLDGPAPVGKYRVELLKDGKMIDGREFEVK